MALNHAAPFYSVKLNKYLRERQTGSFDSADVCSGLVSNNQRRWNGNYSNKVGCRQQLHPSRIKLRSPNLLQWHGGIYAVNPEGQLQFFFDELRNGLDDVDVKAPVIIGQGGWENMKFVFSGGPGIIYAVNQQGQLLFYQDHTQNGTGDVDTPSVIGQGGWQNRKHVFDGGQGIIYAVSNVTVTL